MAAAMSEAKNTASEPMNASMPAPMNENRWPGTSGSSGSTQPAPIHTASTTSRNSTPMTMTTGVLSSPMAMTRSASATQKGAAVVCSGSGGSVYTSGASPPSVAASSACSRSYSGRSLWTTGSDVKLPGGGGELVAHSSVQARHGLSPATSPVRDAAHEVVDEDEQRDGDEVAAQRRDEIERVPAEVGRVGVHAPRHAQEPEDVHGHERRQESQAVQPEVDLAEAVAHAAPEHLGEPVVDAGEEREHGTGEEDVVEVGDHVVRVGHLPVERHRRPASRR